MDDRVVINDSDFKIQVQLHLEAYKLIRISPISFVVSIKEKQKLKCPS